MPVTLGPCGRRASGDGRRIRRGIAPRRGVGKTPGGLTRTIRSAVHYAKELHMSIVITGASGQLGRLVAEAVLERTSDVILVTRDPAKLADLAARGAEVRAGDFGDPGSLVSAFAGVTKALVISTDKVGSRVPGHKAAIDAAAAAGARSIAYTSGVNRRTPTRSR